MSIRIEHYKPEWQPYFEQFNKAWLEEYFTVEPIDEWVLTQPEEAILKKGGSILFALDKEQVIGTVALKKKADGVFELTKMAVDKNYRGKGAGKLLCRSAVDLARQLGASKVILFSQTILHPALSIYRSLGFKDLPVEPGVYARADVMMELPLHQDTPAPATTNHLNA